MTTVSHLIPKTCTTYVGAPSCSKRIALTRPLANIKKGSVCWSLNRRGLSQRWVATECLLEKRRHKGVSVWSRGAWGHAKALWPPRQMWPPDVYFKVYVGYLRSFLSVDDSVDL